MYGGCGTAPDIFLCLRHFGPRTRQAFPRCFWCFQSMKCSVAYMLDVRPLQEFFCFSFGVFWSTNTYGFLGLLLVLPVHEISRLSFRFSVLSRSFSVCLFPLFVPPLGLVLGLLAYARSRHCHTRVEVSTENHTSVWMVWVLALPDHSGRISIIYGLFCCS